MRVLHDAGYTNLAPAGEHSYAYGGMVGSLDHVLASPAAAGIVTGSDIWEINAHEPVGLEYSRHNHNVVDLYAADPYRASDHNPELVGLQFGSAEPAPEPTPEPTEAPGEEPTEEPSEAPTDGPQRPGRGGAGEHPGQGEPGRGAWEQGSARAQEVLENLFA